MIVEEFKTHPEHKYWQVDVIGYEDVRLDDWMHSYTHNKSILVDKQENGPYSLRIDAEKAMSIAREYMKLLGLKVMVITGLKIVTIGWDAIIHLDVENDLACEDDIMEE